MNITLIHFSQTGNTRKVTEVLTDTFLEKGHRVTMVPLSDAEPGDALKGDLLGVGTPCFSSRAPKPMMEYLNSILPIKDFKTFVYATCGGASGRVLQDLALSLQKKGAEVIGGFLVRGQVHHPAPPLVGRFNGRPDESDLLQVRKYGHLIMGWMNRDDPNLNSKKNSLSLVPPSGFYRWVASITSEPVLRIFLPEPILDRKRCDQCRICLEECPMGNITMNPYPDLKSNCIRCYHCYTACPQGAFQTDWRIANLILGFLYHPYFLRLFGDLSPGEAIN